MQFNRRRSDRLGCLLLLFILGAIIEGAAVFALYLLWTGQAEARPLAMQVYLEGEQELGNGYKLCIYSEGVTITVPSHQLCPLTIEV